MTHRLLLAALLLLAMETEGAACSCARPPQDPNERRIFAREDATGALALVEVALVTGYDWELERPQRLRVTRTLIGQAPSTFDVEMPNRMPTANPNLTRCGADGSEVDEEPSTFVVQLPDDLDNILCGMDGHIGDRPRLTLLYRPRRAHGGAVPLLRISSVCSSMWLADDAYRAAVIRAMNRRR